MLFLNSHRPIWIIEFQFRLNLTTSKKWPPVREAKSLADVKDYTPSLQDEWIKLFPWTIWIWTHPTLFILASAASEADRLILAFFEVMA